MLMFSLLLPLLLLVFVRLANVFNIGSNWICQGLLGQFL